MFSSLKIAVALLSALAVSAVPTTLESRQSLAQLSTAQVSSFKPYSWFASSSYCSPSSIIRWNCGANCNANRDFIPVAAGGDGSSVQYWYVGYSPSLGSVIVGHQGTDSSEIQAWLTNVDAFLDTLSPSLFPGLSASIQAHSGFAEVQAQTATTILSAVKATISAYGAKKVTSVGHSLGAALALLDAVYLPLHISGVSFSFVGYGMPRVGNQAFADYVDAHLSVTHINNKQDLVPILPGRFLGYHHSSGEVHIQESGTWVSCPGQDNTSDQCTVGAVPNIFEGSTSDHGGPYDSVYMGC
ncbi:lipase class 3 family protein [Pluteus cervinus]|uniref:Lipase class 3 family protein n=1 Tax=Pluteus cervinus TaxID=181527 RepID=A0ACD3ATT4_9AGAR|nr:lipase class 3 family protein [Pluteus cervinus]